MRNPSSQRVSTMPRRDGRRRSVTTLPVLRTSHGIPSVESVLELANHVSRSEAASSQFAEWLESQGPVSQFHRERHLMAARQFREWLLSEWWRDVT